MTPIDFIITVLSLFYIYYATQNKALCFVFGLMASGLWAYHDFINLNLKFDGFLQIFYVGMSIMGLYFWKKDNSTQQELPISSMSLKEHSLVIVISLGLGIGLAWLTRNIMDTSLPYLDAVTTAFAIMATFILIRRKLQNWIYWIFIDLTYIYIFLKQEAPMLAGIMGVYALLAIYGFWEWKKLYSQEKIERSGG